MADENFTFSSQVPITENPVTDNVTLTTLRSLNDLSCDIDTQYGIHTSIVAAICLLIGFLYALFGKRSFFYFTL